ncbi:Cu_bind_like domain-containing protein [Cephalotus follicularis]|uniref:Cu_bind_like domain-containing protein n=1 Tax=Cephalotus follicularis TaxID=3775 RepID=A0A1Q3DGV3_CEPFO|nr:Cu_bind_like domain-containing protein [Cephalotus follicularis]
MAVHRDVIITMVYIATLFGASSAGTRYTVGDAVWSIPPYPDYYTNWSSSHVFYIRDSLLFEFETELYNVIQVPKQDYDNCTFNNPIKILNSGPTIILLNEEGVFYYICNMSNYCALGQKISVFVQKHLKMIPPCSAPLPSPSVAHFAPDDLPEPLPSEWNRTQSPATVSSPVLLPDGNGNSKAFVMLRSTWWPSVGATVLCLMGPFLFRK